MHLNNMSKFDEKLDRMNFLMEFRSQTKNDVASPVEYHAEGADGKVYGIIKEGAKYYIKTTEKGKENLAESYQYINGFNAKKENEYNGFNEATKQFELKLMSLNEAYGVKKNVSVVDFDKSKKDFAYLTEEARTELNRMNQIFENSCCIGKDNVANLEYHGTANSNNTTENNKPFSEKAEAKLDKDLKDTESCPKCATGEGYKDAGKNVDSDLQSDKMKKGGEHSNNDYKDAPNPDSDGVALAGEHKEGAKAVKMNESIYNDEYENDPESDDLLNGSDGMPAEDDEYFDDDEYDEGPTVDDITDTDEEPIDDEYDDEVGDDLVGTGNEEEVDECGLNGCDECGDALQEAINELEGNFSNKSKSLITGPEDTLDGPNTSDNKHNSVAYAEPHVGKDNGVLEEEDEMIDTNPTPNEKAMRGPKGNGKHLTWDKMNESQKRFVNMLTEDVYNKLVGGKESIQEKIQRMVNEEVTRLNDWGKHPRYRKSPMQLPPNKEVMKGTADRDWNDDSAKGEQPYGSKIGSSAPFNNKVNAITNSVLNEIKKNLKNRK